MSNSAPGTPGENKMGVQPVGRLLFGMAIPMMFSMLFQALYNVVDSIFVARVGQDALNAVSLAFPLQNLMIGVAVGTAVGMNALLSRSLGEGKQDAADRVANVAIFLSLCGFAVFAVIGLVFSRLFFGMLTQNPQIIAYGSEYTGICLGVSVGCFGQCCFERMLQSTGRTSLSMVTQVLGAAINIVLDPILIFGLFGFPRMEVAGAAVATVAGQIVAAALALYLNARHNPDVHLDVRAVRWHGPTAREIYHIAIPSILMMSVGSVMNFFLNRILISFTEAATAVFGAYFKLQSFIFMPVFGLNNAMVPIIAYNYGAAKAERMKRTIRLATISAICVMSAGLLVFQFAPGVLLGFFDPSDEMREIGAVALRVISLCFPLAGFCIVAGSVCQAIGNPLYSLVVAVCRQLVVLLPSAWLLSLTGRLELVWLAFVIAEGVSLALSAVFLRRTLKAADENFRARGVAP